MYDFVAIDFETANNNLNSACSIGIVAVKDLEIVERQYYLIKTPTDTFRNDNVLIHGITYDDVKDCEQFPAIWDKIKHYFNNIMVAHNAHFDFSVLKNLFDTYSIEYRDIFYIDSRTVAGRICNCGTSLNDISEYLHITLNNHHNALDDAEACANILIRLVKECNLPSFIHYSFIHGSDLVKSFSNIKANKTFRNISPTAYNHVKISDITAATSDFNGNHAFYQKSIVLTGELESFERPEAMQRIVDVGGIIKSSVSKKTDYLIVGVQDKKLVGEDGMSSKEEKAYDLIKEGYDIKIIDEKEFLSLLG